MALVLLLALLAQAPVEGRVVDLGREAPVPRARVTVVETGGSARTDRAGRFTLPALPPGTYTLRAGEPPFETVEVQVTVPDDGGRPEPVEIGLFDQVESVSVTEIAPRERPAPGGTQIVREEVTVVPGARGDVLSAVQSLPGIAQTGTFSYVGGLVIRGSAPADSRVFVDGIEVPILFHFFNLQSILPSEMIDDIVYAPGGFGVEYGRASAGIIEVRSRRGKPEWHGHVEASFINAAVLVQGPLLGSNRKGRHDPTFSVAFRRSFVDAILPAVIPEDADLSFTALPRYYDYQLRLDWQPSDRWRLAVFLFGTHDALDLTSTADNAADPLLTGARFRNVTSFVRGISSATYETDRLRSRTALSLMGGSFTFDAGPERYLLFEATGVSLRNESRVRVLPRLTLRAGGEMETWFLDVDVKFPRPPREGDARQPNLTFDPPIVYSESYPTSYVAAWTAADLEVTSRLTLGAGLRYDGFLRSYDHVAQPRGEARFKLHDGTTLRAAGGLYTRAPDFNDEGAERHLDPERAWQGTLGIEHQIVPGLTVQTTGFHTWRSDLIVWETNRADPRSSARAYVNRGTGRTYGGELFLHARGRRSFGWLAYTLSRSLRRDAPDAGERLFDFDQTHNLIAVASWGIDAAQRWRLGGRFQYTTGKPYTPVTGRVFASDYNRYLPEFGAVNSRRYEAQHQLDLRLDRLWRFQGWTLSAYLDITNVYMHPAPLDRQYSHDFTESQPITTVPILPALGLKGAF